MDVYTIGKFLHVAVAIVWVGGAAGMILLGTLAARAGDSERLIWVARLTESLAKMVFMPSSIIILIIGVFLVWLQWSFLDAWVVFGIAGVVMTGAIGGVVLTPLVTKLAGMEAGPERDAVATKLLRSARADLIMLFTIIWAMVARPGWSDVGQLVVMVAVIVLGAALYLRR